MRIKLKVAKPKRYVLEVKREIDPPSFKKEIKGDLIGYIDSYGYDGIFVGLDLHIEENKKVQLNRFKLIPETKVERDLVRRLSGVEFDIGGTFSYFGWSTYTARTEFKQFKNLLNRILVITYPMKDQMIKVNKKKTNILIKYRGMVNPGDTIEGYKGTIDLDVINRSAFEIKSYLDAFDMKRALVYIPEDEGVSWEETKEVFEDAGLYDDSRVQFIHHI